MINRWIWGFPHSFKANAIGLGSSQHYLEVPGSSQVELSVSSGRNFGSGWVEVFFRHKNDMLIRCRYLYRQPNGRLMGTACDSWKPDAL